MNCRIFYLQKTLAEPRNSIASHASHQRLGTCAIKYKTCTQIWNSLLLNTPHVRTLVPGRPDLNVIRAVQITGAPAPRGTKSSLAVALSPRDSEDASLQWATGMPIPAAGCIFSNFKDWRSGVEAECFCPHTDISTLRPRHLQRRFSERQRSERV